MSTISHSFAGSEVHTAKTDMSLSSEPGDTSSATPALSSQEVSQSVPQSGLSPVLANYKKYLQSCYNARVLAPADKYLPTLESPYITLAMIRKGHYNHEQRDEFTKKTLHGGVDQILQNKIPINIEDLLSPEEYNIRAEGRCWDMDEDMETVVMEQNYEESPGTQLSQITQYSKRTVRFVLVEGPPGIGKSTFAWEVCRRWDEIESFRDYHTVVLLKLREKWVLNATSLSGLLRYPSHPDFSNSVAEELVKSQGKKLLFILDGFDEVSHSFHENSVIKSILCRQLLPECTIILTTRPVAMYTLRNICQPQVDKHVEIIGFTEEERVKYITEVFSKEPELQVNFLKYMFLIPHIKSMMYIPLNCAIIAQVYFESQSSHHLAIPRTRTQLYKALTHSLLVRHMKMKEIKYDYTSMLPGGLDEESMKNFKTLAKFAFDAYHRSESRKVTFFKGDIPEGLVHFGFMNESTELYAGKGVEQTFSFLHLSLQEYLAAWYLADSYSIEFQVAYHRLAIDCCRVRCKGDCKDEETIFSSLKQQRSSLYLGLDTDNEGLLEKVHSIYKGDIKEEEALIMLLGQKRPALFEPAIFLAGITGWRCQSNNDSNRWELYLSHDTAGVGNTSILVWSLYEAQNPALLPHYFTTERSDCRNRFLIGSETMEKQDFDPDPYAAYDCYAFSYCLANSSYQKFSLSFGFNFDEDISKVEVFVKGLNNHSKYSKSRVKLLVFKKSPSTSVVNRGLLWLTKATLLTTTEEIYFESVLNSSVVEMFLQSLVKLKSFNIHIDSPSSWELVAALKTLKEVEVLHISISEEFSPPPTDLYLQLDQKLAKVVSDTKLHSKTLHDFSPTNIQVDCLSLILASNPITKMVLSSISRQTMASVHNILLHCPTLAILELERTRLGYDGILHICSALRNNTTLRHLVIHDSHQLPSSRKTRKWIQSMERDPLPGKTTCTDFLLELKNILKDNTSLEEMKITSGLFFPVSQERNFELSIKSKLADELLQTFVKIQMLPNYIPLTISLESMRKQRVLRITNKAKFYSEKAILDISNISLLNSEAINLVLNITLKLNTFANILLSSISRETMAGVHDILLHCPSLTTLELKRTRLGYDGILYICSALRNNTTLQHLVIYDDLQLPPSRKKRKKFDNKFSSFSHIERESLPGKTTCTEFLLELNNILKDNTTLEEMKIQSGLFLPLSTGEDGEYCQWTGLGPLQQFNVGAVGFGISPKLRRSFSLSDLTQPQTIPFWDRQFHSCYEARKFDFGELFFKQGKNKGINVNALDQNKGMNFTALDTEVLKSFSGLDLRLKECLEISHFHKYVERLREDCWGMLGELGYLIFQMEHSMDFQIEHSTDYSDSNSDSV